MVSPSLADCDLAYETGFHLGDGSLGHYSRDSYRYVLSGNRSTEYEFYREDIIPLIRKLYALTPSLSTYGNSVYATVYSKELFLFKTEILGLPAGRKTELRLPTSVLRQGKKSTSKLVSGLYDADGSLKARKTVSGIYPRLSFAQKWKEIVAQTKVVLSSEFGISSTMYLNDYFDRRVSKHELRWFLDINGYENLRKFAKHIGSRHPVILERMRWFMSIK